MTEEKLKASLVAARIEMLLEQAGIGNDDMEPGEYDAILDGLEEDKRRQLEEYTDRMAKQEAARGEVLYLGGICDGIRLMGKIHQIGRGTQGVRNPSLKKD